MNDEFCVFCKKSLNDRELDTLLNWAIRSRDFVCFDCWNGQPRSKRLPFVYDRGLGYEPCAMDSEEERTVQPD
jgi:hypothetical protein